MLAYAQLFTLVWVNAYTFGYETTIYINRWGEATLEALVLFGLFWPVVALQRTDDSWVGGPAVSLAGLTMSGGRGVNGEPPIDALIGGGRTPDGNGFTVVDHGLDPTLWNLDVFNVPGSSQQVTRADVNVCPIPACETTPVAAQGVTEIPLPAGCAAGGVCQVLVEWNGPDLGAFRPGLGMPVFLAQGAGGAWAGSTLDVAGFSQSAGLGANGDVSAEAVVGAGRSVEGNLLALLDDAAFDFGDAPAPYPTLLADAGAAHALSTGLFLGSCADAEGDGQPSAAADGDDTGAGGSVVGSCAGAGDEDGVAFPAELVGGLTGSVEVTASASGRLDAWIDWNADGDWDDAGEQILTAESVTAGTSTLSFPVPAGIPEATTVARVRLSSSGGLAPTGFALDGEVEDHPVVVRAPTVLEIPTLGEWALCLLGLALAGLGAVRLRG
ncbi:MAG: IPTL-CTERM sorting domain-containing protein [Thermoanaerobaculia bacterium]